MLLLLYSYIWQWKLLASFVVTKTNSSIQLNNLNRIGFCSKSDSFIKNLFFSLLQNLEFFAQNRTIFCSKSEMTKMAKC